MCASCCHVCNRRRRTYAVKYAYAPAALRVRQSTGNTLGFASPLGRTCFLFGLDARIALPDLPFRRLRVLQRRFAARRPAAQARLPCFAGTFRYATGGLSLRLRLRSLRFLTQLATLVAFFFEKSESRVAALRLAGGASPPNDDRRLGATFAEARPSVANAAPATLSRQRFAFASD